MKNRPLSTKKTGINSVKTANNGNTLGDKKGKI
jgi:hypothetical protein